MAINVITQKQELDKLNLLVSSMRNRRSRALHKAKWDGNHGDQLAHYERRQSEVRASIQEYFILKSVITD